jgi:hypothetical protein
MITIGEYLSTSYKPDLEYVDGELLERNVAEWDHSWLQAEHPLLFDSQLGCAWHFGHASSSRSHRRCAFSRRCASPDGLDENVAFAGRKLISRTC